MRYVTVEVKQQSEATLSGFMRFISAWEIPISAIKSEAAYGIITHQKREISAEEWARHKNIAFPNVKSTYVLHVNPEQEEAVRDFVNGRKFWSASE